MDSLAPQSTRLVETATRAALAVEQMLLDAFRSTVNYSYKRDRHDIVTEYDRASEEKIAAVIMAEVPDSTIVGEERGAVGEGAVRWYVDPIDGTTNFARGIAYWCISIAAAIDDRVMAGVILDPVARHLFSASLSGAFLNGERLHADAASEENRAVILTGFPNPRHLAGRREMALDSYVELLDGFLAVRNPGSAAIQLAHVAAGWADAAMGIDTNPWDVAAGMLLIEQAGGRCAGFGDGMPYSPAHLAADYYAVGQDADYATLDRVVSRLSRHAPVPAKEVAPQP